VATQARNDGTFNNLFNVNLQRNVPVKKNGKSIKSFGREFVASLFRHTLYIIVCSSVVEETYVGRCITKSRRLTRRGRVGEAM